MPIGVGASLPRGVLEFKGDPSACCAGGVALIALEGAGAIAGAATNEGLLDVGEAGNEGARVPRGKLDVPGSSGAGAGAMLPVSAAVGANPPKDPGVGVGSRMAAACAPEVEGEGAGTSTIVAA